MLAATLRRTLAVARQASLPVRTSAAAPMSSWSGDKQGSVGSAYDDPNVPAKEGVIPTMRDQSTGINRAEEVVMDSFGVELFDRDAVYADGDQGTYEEPICIFSHAHHRVVGVTYPEDSFVRYFTLFEGYKAFDPESCNFFALRVVPYTEVEEFVRSAEWDEHKDRYVVPGNRPGYGSH